MMDLNDTSAAAPNDERENAMARLEDLTRGALVKGIDPSGPVTVIDASWRGTDVVELTFKTPSGALGSELLFRDREPTLEILDRAAAWGFDAPGDLFRLATEAYRIHLAHLFDPLLAVHTSLVEPLPHQITAVYGEMLARQPLRFLLADDPGAGKTIMAGLFIKELLMRGDIERCLIVCPGILVEQWQDELDQKFHLPFKILTRDDAEAARTGNWFQESPLAICRLDMLARNDDLQTKLRQVDWDLAVFDEAHKCSASYFSGDMKATLRYKLARLVSGITRHFLLMTATPHNGKEDDFQLFMALIDGDRFEGKYRDAAHTADVSDMMRRMVKEDLVKFDGRPLFPERHAHTVDYKLSDEEAALYKAVTDYVRDEFNRADRLESEGRRNTVGFALTVLQRRLASSPEAIVQSLRRRRERLIERLEEEKLEKRGADALIGSRPEPELRSEDDYDDLDEAPDDELDKQESEIVDRATASRTIAELEAEIATLGRLEALALSVRRSGRDRKWEELSSILQDKTLIFQNGGERRKLVVFTEHRDTLNYLVERIRTLVGRPDQVAQIHGGMGRDERRKTQKLFMQDKDTLILVATDAAGEGINLYRAHLMVNYDLPWNPNRLEQRFGRIHRIGQTEVCHMWNLVAGETREGAVYRRLLDKVEEQRAALQGKVFNVLGGIVFEGVPLKDLLVEAIRYGDRPEVRERMERVIDGAFDAERLRDLFDERALAHDALDARRLQKIREDMERAAARRLQPHYISSFFLEAFRRLGGRTVERESGRYEVLHVPGSIRSRDRQIGVRAPVLRSYERIAFEKELLAIPGKPVADFVCPGHPLLDATLDLTLERSRGLLKQGAVLVDRSDPEETPRVLVCLEHAVRDGRPERLGLYREISRQVRFVEIEKDGKVRSAGFAPHLDYEPLSDEERGAVEPHLREAWLSRDLEETALTYAAAEIVPEHFAEARARREEFVEKSRREIKKRLTAEIIHWNHRAQVLKDMEAAGKKTRLPWSVANQRAEELQTRLQNRMEEMDRMRRVSAAPPVVVSGAVVIPAGLLDKILGTGEPEAAERARETRRVERLAVEAVLAAERALGNEPSDVGAEKRGYDVESKDPRTKRLRFIEVKGRAAGAATVTVTKNEILTCLNKPEDYILAIVEVDGDAAQGPRYVRRPFRREPDFGVTSVNYDLGELLARAEAPGA
jgi:superfamily II DNA or RNA helicase